MIVLFLFFLLLVPACRKDKSNLITYDLKRRDYIETLDALGTVQAVNNFTILAPVTPITNLLQLTHLVKDGTHVKKGDTICVFNVPELSGIYFFFASNPAMAT